MALFLNDEEFFEGILGGLGWIISIHYFRQAIQGDPIIIGVITWMILWFTRKIGMRIYRTWRENNLTGDYGFSIANFTNVSDNLFKLIVFVVMYMTLLGYCYSKL